MIEHLFIDEKGVAPTKGKAIARVLMTSLLVCFPLGIAIAEYVKASRMEGFRHAVGTVVASEVNDDTESLHREAPYSAVQKAEFVYEGRTRIGATRAFGSLTSDAAEADATRRKYPVGATVDVWFEPDKLPEIVLDRSSTTGPAIAIVAIALVWLLLTWLYFIPQLQRAWNPEQPKLMRSKVGMRLFFLTGFLVATISFGFLFIKPVLEVGASRSWAQTPAQIISVNTIEHRDKLVLWKTDVRYSYQVGGQQFTSNVYNPTECTVPNESPRRQAVSIYSPGSTIACYVDPHDPARATLTRHISRSIGIGVWVVVFIALFGICAFTPNIEKLDHIQLKSVKVVLVICILVAALVVGTSLAVFAVP